MYSKVRIKEGYVVIYYTANGSTMRFKTGVKINSPKEWNQNKEMLTTRVEGYKEKMKIINLWKTRADQAINEAYKEGYKISGKELNLHLQNHRNGLVLPKTTKLSELYERFYNDKKDELLNNAKKSPESLKDYTSLKNTIADYEREVNENLTISEIFDKNWCKQFERWLSKSRKKNSLTKGGLNARTIRKRFDVLKTFSRWLEEQDIIKNISPLVNYKISVSDAIIDTLSIDEVRALYDFDLESERLERVRDLFVFCAHTGVRWMDLVTIRKAHLTRSEDGVLLSKITHKSRNTSQERLSVPLSKTALEILEKYNYNLDLLSHPKANKYIKEALKKTEMFEEEMEKKSSEGKFMKRHEYFSFHDARRTFITNLVNSAIPVNEIMKYTGHKKISTLQQYIDKNRPTSFNHIKILD